MTVVAPQRIRDAVQGWKSLRTCRRGSTAEAGQSVAIGKPGGAYTPMVQDQRHAWQLFKSVAVENPDWSRLAVPRCAQNLDGSACSD